MREKVWLTLELGIYVNIGRINIKKTITEIVCITSKLVKGKYPINPPKRLDWRGKKKTKCSNLEFTTCIKWWQTKWHPAVTSVLRSRLSSVCWRLGWVEAHALPNPLHQQGPWRNKLLMEGLDPPRKYHLGMRQLPLVTRDQNYSSNELRPYRS